MSTPSFQKVTPRDEHEDDLTPEDLAAHKRKRRWIIAMCVIIVLGGIIVFNARNISHGIKGWQAERAAKQSEQFLAAKDYKNAQAKLQDALALSPQNLAAMQAAGRFLTTVGNHRDAIAFWKQIEEKGPLSQADQRQYATSILATGDLLSAKNRLKLAWPSDQPGTPEDWMLALGLALQNRDQAEATNLAEKLMAAETATPDQRLKAATLMTSSPDADKRRIAWNSIEKLSQQKDETALEALVTLARRAAAAHSTATPMEKTSSPKEVADAIDANPKAAAKHLLFAMDLRLIAEPLRKAELIAAAEGKFTKTDDDIESLTAWLYGKGEFRKVLEHLPADVATHRRSLFLQRLDAMASMGMWAEVADEITSANFSLDKLTAEMFLARCAKELGQQAGSDNHWQSALDAANGNAQQLVQVAEYAEKAGNIAIAKAGYQAATEARGDFLGAYQRLLAIGQAQGNTGELNTTLRRMAAQWPDEAAVKNDLAYTNLLLGKDVEESTRTAEALYAKEPASLPHRITLSLAKLKAGNPAEALSLLENLTGDFGSLEGRKRAVHAAALWANDRQEDARATLKEVKPEQLLPEERELVSGVR